MRLEDLIGLEPERRTATLDEVLAFSEENEVGGLHEGFWVDHWHYNVDLLEVLLMVYPDRLDELLCGGSKYGFFDDPGRGRAANPARGERRRQDPKLRRRQARCGKARAHLASAAKRAMPCGRATARARCIGRPCW